MPKRSSKKIRPADVNALAASIVAADVGDEKLEVENKLIDDWKNPAAVALGRLGGKKGGKARAAKLSPEKRSEIARKAAVTRWAAKVEKNE